MIEFLEATFWDAFWYFRPMMRYYQWHAFLATVIGALTVPIFGGLFYFIREIFTDGLSDVWGFVYPLGATSIFQALLFLHGRRWSLWQYYFEWRARRSSDT